MLIIRANVRMQRKYKQALFSLTKSIINKTVDVPNVDIQNFVGHKSVEIFDNFNYTNRRFHTI